MTATTITTTNPSTATSSSPTTIYKELVLPEKFEIDEKTATDTYAKFTAEPYERGYGHTIGNALRRVLLSSLDGAAVTAVRFAGARHEYDVLEGVQEDVIQVMLNLKKLKIKLFSNGPEQIYLNAGKEGAVRAGQLQESANVKVVNPDLVFAHLQAGGKLEMEMEVNRGRGYVPAEDLQTHYPTPAGFLPLDVQFSPITKVNYEVENARVGRILDYDRLVLEVWTDGSVSPKEAVAQAAELLQKALAPFVPQREMAAEGAAPGEFSAGGALAAGDMSVDSKLKDLLGQPVDNIELSSRASNCLKVARIKSIGELVQKKEEELLSVKNFGKKSLDEIKERLKDMGLSLGMKA
ncbi:MAG: DNA-directed RNA polymerase subunit alpha [Elusimicrobia bacterium]|nr:DNA-directed RNA polymerase subunit alpha [Elusimicrobiota bacterium]